MGTHKLDFSKRVNQKVKKNIAAKGNEIPEWPRWSSGSFSLDAELGGGIPKGKIIGILGEYSSGKTATALKVAAKYQKSTDKPMVWIDAEGAWDPRWATTLGVDTARVDVVRPLYGEQAYDIILSAYDEGFGLAILDSVAALSAKSEIEGDMDDIQVAAMAKITSKFMRKIDKGLLENDDPPTFIYLNQLRHNIGYGSPIIETGGDALKYYPSVKIWLKSGGYTDGEKVYDYTSAIEEGIEIKGQAIKFFIEKNKTAPPKRRGHFWFYFDTLDKDRRKGAIDNTEECVRLAKKYDIVERSGSWYYFTNKDTGEQRKFQGSNDLVTFIREDNRTREYIQKEVLDKVLSDMTNEKETNKETTGEKKLAHLREVKDNEAERNEGSKAI